MLCLDETGIQLPKKRRQAQKSPAKRKFVQSATSSASSSQASSCWTQEVSIYLGCCMMCSYGVQ
jgi:hypothetical protein